MSAQNENNEFKNEIWLFIGNHLDKDKVGVTFKTIGEDGTPTGNPMYFTPAKKVSFASGGLYELPVKRTSDDGVTTRISEAKFKGMISDRDLLNELQLKQRIFNEDLRQRQLEKKYKNGFELPDNWGEIVALYRKCNGAQKETFRAMLINKLTQDAWKK
ncbi:MAG: hypothetical protein K1X72_04395 [Pyrinomonadaceae bacterium]|nr:hypothetical protein [Pyrinomonadaceae bacterium]